jgi:hypothetical protein
MTDFSRNALGKQRPSNAPAIMLADLLTGVVPPTPTEADYFANVTNWHLGRNDDFGTCGPTAVANHLLVTQANLGALTARLLDAHIFDLYRRSGNPNFNPTLPGDDPRQDDNGVILQKMLGALLADGIGGHRPLAYARISPGDMDTLDKAIAIFGGVLLGLDLKVPQQRQNVWDAVGGSEWGGHAVMAGAYTNQVGTTADRTRVITWAEDVAMTHNFVAAQEDEAWVIIWPEHLGSRAFLEGVDVNALASAYEELTGRPFPSIPEPPEPTPAPPAPDAGEDLAVALRRFLNGKRVPAYLRTAAEDWLGER